MKKLLFVLLFAFVPFITSAQTTPSLVISSDFVSFNYTVGDPLPTSVPINLFNQSNTDTIYFNISVPNQPSWINTGYSTETLPIGPSGIMGMGVSVDPTKVGPGNYSYDIGLVGNFVGSPKKISVTLNVISVTQFQAQAPTISYVSPTSAKVGDTVYVYGTNFNNATFIGIDGGSGVAQPSPSSVTIFSPNKLSFVVPWLSVGAHTIAVAEKAGPWNLGSPTKLNVISTQQTQPTYTSPTPTTTIVPTTVTPTAPAQTMTDMQKNELIKQLQTLLMQLIQQLIVLLQTQQGR